MDTNAKRLSLACGVQNNSSVEIENVDGWKALRQSAALPFAFLADDKKGNVKIQFEQLAIFPLTISTVLKFVDGTSRNISRTYNHIGELFTNTLQCENIKGTMNVYSNSSNALKKWGVSIGYVESCLAQYINTYQKCAAGQDHKRPLLCIK